MGIVLNQVIACLCEGKGDHRERDPAATQADRAQDQREHKTGRQRREDRGQQRPVPYREGDVQAVGAEGEVQNLAEGQQAGEAEQHVVAERHGGEDEAEAENVEGARRVEDVHRPGEHPGHREPGERYRREHRDQNQGGDPSGP